MPVNGYFPTFNQLQVDIGEQGRRYIQRMNVTTVDEFRESASSEAGDISRVELPAIYLWQWLLIYSRITVGVAEHSDRLDHVFRHLDIPTLDNKLYEIPYRLLSIKDTYGWGSTVTSNLETTLVRILDLQSWTENPNNSYIFRSLVEAAIRFINTRNIKPKDASWFSLATLQAIGPHSSTTDPEIRTAARARTQHSQVTTADKEDAPAEDGFHGDDIGEEVVVDVAPLPELPSLGDDIINDPILEEVPADSEEEKSPDTADTNEQEERLEILCNGGLKSPTESASSIENLMDAIGRLLVKKEYEVTKGPVVHNSITVKHTIHTVEISHVIERIGRTAVYSIVTQMPFRVEDIYHIAKAVGKRSGDMGLSSHKNDC